MYDGILKVCHHEELKRLEYKNMCLLFATKSRVVEEVKSLFQILSIVLQKENGLEEKENKIKYIKRPKRD